MDKRKVRARRRAKNPPMSSEMKAARMAIIQADLLGFEANQLRVRDLTKGGYGGGVRIRAAGSDIRSRYTVGKPKADKGAKNYIIPPPPKQYRPKRKGR